MELFVNGSLECLIREEHILARVNRVLDLGWLRNDPARRAMARKNGFMHNGICPYRIICDTGLTEERFRP